MNKAIKDAIRYAEGKLDDARLALDGGAIGKAHIDLENARTVLRAATLMNDLTAPAQHTIKNLRDRIAQLATEVVA